MIKKNFKGRCVRKYIDKSKSVCRTYNSIQTAYLDVLQNREDISEIRCNVLLDEKSIEDYTTDFVCVKTNGKMMVRECVFRKLIAKPMNVKLLDKSREYWTNRGVKDWGVVTDAEK